MGGVRERFTDHDPAVCAHVWIAQVWGRFCTTCGQSHVADRVRWEGCLGIPVISVSGRRSAILPPYPDRRVLFLDEV